MKMTVEPRKPAEKASVSEPKGKSSLRREVTPLPADRLAMSNHEPRWARLVVWIVFAFAIWGFISMIGCMVMVAHAGTCRIYGEGTDTVEACTDGSFSVKTPIWRAERRVRAVSWTG